MMEKYDQRLIRCQEIAEDFKVLHEKRPLNATGITISCDVCPDAGAGGSARAYLVNSTPLTIVLCVNRMRVYEIKEALTHEYVHAFDYSYSRYDFTTCTGLASSEVRAAREAECANGYFPLRWMERLCIRRAAAKSTENLFPGYGKQCVDLVFEEAMLDCEPKALQPSPK